MLRHAITVMLALAFASPAPAVDFDPVKHGLADPSREMIRRGPVMTCTFLRNAVEGTKKVWSCDDGSTRYGESDIWSRPEASVSETTETVEFDPSINVPGHSFMTITNWINNRHCQRAGKMYTCSGREVQSFSHMLVPLDHDACMKMAEKIAYRDYVEAQQADDRIRISFDCE